MQLLMSSTSPFVRKTRVLIRETGLTEHIEEVPVVTTPLATDPKIPSANPAGKIPALLREDGPAIYDSRVICRYLDHIAEAGLYPEPRLWEVLTLEASADALMEAAVAIVYEARLRPVAEQSEEIVEAQWLKCSRLLTALEERWISLLNGPLQMGQIATGCALAYLDFRMDERNWRAGHPQLAAWFEEFAKRPSMIATQPVES